MFITYYCENGCRYDIDENDTREKAEASAQEAYADDAGCGELGKRRYAVMDADHPRDYADEIVFPDIDDNDDAEEDEK